MSATPKPAAAATTPAWPAPQAHGPVVATVGVPGSKSETNRLLVLAALAGSSSRLRRPLRSRDTELMATALRRLGATIIPDGDDWVVDPPPGAGLRGPASVDCGLAGTVMRFVPPMAGLATGAVDFDGDPHARTRPMGVVIQALRDLGVAVDDGGRGALPFVVTGAGGVRGGAVTIDASASSQFVSGLLLSGHRFDDGLTVHHVGRPVPSLPHVAMTVAVLRAAGADVRTDEPDSWSVGPALLDGRDVVVEPDLSNAAPFLAAALVTGGRVTVPGWPRVTTQAGDALRDLLARMGAEVVLDDSGLTVSGGSGVLGLDADLHDVGELTPVLAAVAALADGPSHLTGIGHLRGHETDRLAALARELGALGADVEETADALRITPRPMHGGVFATYDDHRLATAASVIGLVVPGIEVENVATTAKTLPGFTSMWAAMLDAGRSVLA